MGQVETKQPPPPLPVFNRGCYDNTGLIEYVKQRRESNTNPYSITIYFFQCEQFVKKFYPTRFGNEEIERIISDVFADKPHTITTVGMGYRLCYVVQFVQGMPTSS